MESSSRKPRSWPEKFRDAFRGLGIGVRTQNSFQVHVICAVGVCCVAALVRMCAWQWCVLLLCVAMVMVAEIFNTSLEVMAKAIDVQYHPQLRDALDIASGAVLLAAIGAVLIGSIVMGAALVG